MIGVRHSWSFLRRIAFGVLIIGTAVLLGCATTPEVPDPDLSGMEPRVVSALQAGREAVLTHPGSAEAWGDLGALYDAHLFSDLAVVCYRRAQEIAPAEFEWIYLLAIVREIQGADVEELNDLFGRAVALDPDYAPLRVRYGDALWRRGRYEEAQAELQRAVALAPQMAMAHRRLGQVLLSLGDTEQAAKQLARAVTLEPEDLAAYSGLAGALMRLGQTERARAIQERAAGLEPVSNLEDSVYARRVFMRNVSSSGAFSRAIAAVRGGDYGQAVRDLEIVLQVRPDDASVHYWMGLAHARQGQGPAAYEHLARAVELDPAMVQARIELGHVLNAAGRHDEAAEQLERAATFGPPN
jgi:tetratricopeptide (TPR) repeat protein